MSYNIRYADIQDFYKGFIDLLEHGFTPPNREKITESTFQEYITPTESNLGIHRHVFVIENDNKIIATATVIIERKLIHNTLHVGRIEDVVVHHDTRGKSIGKQLINYCIQFAKTKNCYKCILDCSEDNVGFYKKCNTDLHKKGIAMAIYFN